MREKRESELEQSHARRAKRAGWMVEKIMRTSRNGFPDRFYAKGGRVVLMEWKRPGGILRAIQRVRHAELRMAGVEVYVVNSIADADAILQLDNGNGRDPHSASVSRKEREDDMALG